MMLRVGRCSGEGEGFTSLSKAFGWCVRDFCRMCVRWVNCIYQGVVFSLLFIVLRDMHVKAWDMGQN